MIFIPFVYIMGAGYSSPCGEGFLGPPSFQTVYETPPVSEEGSHGSMTPQLCPSGYEIVQDPVAAPGTEPNEPPLDEALSDLMRQLEMQRTVEVLDWQHYAAVQEKVIIWILNWAHGLINIAKSLQESHHDVVARLATTQDEALALQRGLERAESERASLESRLRETKRLLNISNARTMALFGEKQQIATEYASMKRRMDCPDRQEEPLSGSLSRLYAKDWFV